MKKVILEFLTKYGLKVDQNETMDEIESMMMDHICILFNDIEYYIPNNHPDYTDDEKLTYKVLEEIFAY
jgi:hypothetical protein